MTHTAKESQARGCEAVDNQHAACRVESIALLDELKPGDKVRYRAPGDRRIWATALDYHTRIGVKVKRKKCSPIWIPQHWVDKITRKI